MKKIFFILAITASLFMNAQNSQFGIQGGVNYNYSGDLTEIQDSAEDIVHGASDKSGYHGGLWYKLKFSDMFVRAEVLYTQFENGFEGGDPSYSITTKKIDIPVVFGMKVLGPIYIFAGPDFQYIMDQDFSSENTRIEYEDFTLGIHVGLGVEFNRIALDVRWDKALSSGSLDFIDDNFTLDNRPNQLVFSLHYALTK